MTALEHRPSQRQLVHRLIDWEHVKYNRKCYPAIGQAFPLEMLTKGCESPPYYCHYMAWYLGTWPHECELVKRLEGLFHCAAELPNWQHEKSLLSDTEFSVFWSLVWQLQVAEHLREIGKDVRWSKSGPDLSVTVGDEHWFVECYTHRKSFGLFSFLEELLLRLDQDIRTNYRQCLPFSLPCDRDRERFLHEVLSPFLDPAYLQEAKARAEQEYPQVLYMHQDSSLCVYVDGKNDNAYTPGIVPNECGNPESYLETALREAVSAKRNANDLKNHHPNLVAVNYSLSGDYQLAKSLRGSPAIPENEPHIDVLAVSAVGIDERLTRDRLEVVTGGRFPHVNQENLNQIARVND